MERLYAAWFPTVWHSGEDKTMETTEILIKRKVVAGKGPE